MGDEIAKNIIISDVKSTVKEKRREEIDWLQSENSDKQDLDPVSKGEQKDERSLNRRGSGGLQTILKQAKSKSAVRKSTSQDVKQDQSTNVKDHSTPKPKVVQSTPKSKVDKNPPMEKQSAPETEQNREIKPDFKYEPRKPPDPPKKLGPITWPPQDFVDDLDDVTQETLLANDGTKAPNATQVRDVRKSRSRSVERRFLNKQTQTQPGDPRSRARSLTRSRGREVTWKVFNFHHNLEP